MKLKLQWALALLFIMTVLYLIPAIAAWDYLDKLIHRKHEGYWKLVGKAYGYWGMLLAVNTNASR